MPLKEKKNQKKTDLGRLMLKPHHLIGLRQTQKRIWPQLQNTLNKPCTGPHKKHMSLITQN